jgi:hypothetical protein
MKLDDYQREQIRLRCDDLPLHPPKTTWRDWRDFIPQLPDEFRRKPKPDPGPKKPFLTTDELVRGVIICAIIYWLL